MLAFFRKRRNPELTILCLLASNADRDRIDALGRRHRWGVLFAANRAEAERAAKHAQPSILLIDRDVAGTGWRELLAVFAALAESACIILVSSTVDDALWNEVVRSGGYETLAKPLNERDVLRAVKMAQSWTSTIRK